MTKRVLQIAASLLLLHAHTGLALQQQHPRTLYKADSLVRAAVHVDHLPGAVLLVAQDGGIVFHKAYGHAKRYAFGGTQLAAPEMMTITHQFDVASLTKVFATTFGIMMLVDAGEITLDDPVHRHLALFTGPDKDSVTVRHLLTHTSGLHPWKPLYYHASSAEETYAYISKLALAAPVGQTRRYSDLGFMLLGYLIEEISGQSLDDFLQNRLYKRLGLQHTSFTPAEGPFVATSHGNPFEKRMVADDDFGYVCDEIPESFTDWRTYVLQGEVNDGNAFHANEGGAGHAGLFSTAAELNTLLSLLLNKGEHEEQQLISRDVIEAFLTPTETGHGLGWAMAAPTLPVDAPPPGTFGHTGFTGTFAVAVPAAGLSIILLTNRQQTNVGPDGRYMSLTSLRKSVVSAVLEMDNLH
ncbi:MAG: serine hydrolase [Bacteroidota bacterium]